MQRDEKSTPGWVGLCPDPEHAQEFYMPEPAPGEKCPECAAPLIHFLPLSALNRSEPGCAYFTSPAMQRLADEHERLREAALAVVEFVESRPGWQVPLLRALVADLRSVLSPVNPQEDE